MIQARGRHGAPPDADELIDRYYDKVFNLAFRTLGRREDAEDIAQQTFLRALPRLQRRFERQTRRAPGCIASP